MVTKVIGLGAGGHAKVVVEVLRFYNSYEITGLLDPKPKLQGRNLLGVPVIGNDDLLPDERLDWLAVRRRTAPRSWSGGTADAAGGGSS